MICLSFSGLRARLVLLVLLALAPAFGLIHYTGLEERRQQAVELQENAVRLVRLTSTRHAQLIEEARHLLIVLAQLPQVRRGDAATCNALFADLLKQYPSIPASRLPVRMGTSSAALLPSASRSALPTAPGISGCFRHASRSSANIRLVGSVASPWSL